MYYESKTEIEVLSDTLSYMNMESTIKQMIAI